MHRFRASLLTAIALFACAPVHAAKVEKVDIQGLDPAMTDNVRVSLSLVESIGRDVSGRRLAYLLNEAEAETRQALEPFGYYSPTITISDSRGPRPVRAPGDDADRPPVPATPRGPQAPVTVTISVQAGDPVRVRNSDIAILGPGAQDRYLAQDIAAFNPRPGAVFEHAVYDSNRALVSRRLAERGYFDADFETRRVEVTRAQFAADIDLVWDSGERYDMGVVTFEQVPDQIIRDGLLDKLVYWDEGDYFHQGRLDRLRTSLTKLDYFSRIDIVPQPDKAVDLRVPVQVTLTPAKRSIYTAGLSYGTGSGLGVRGSVERRYVNSRGHKALALVDYAQKRKQVTLQYRVPAFAWLDGWYTASLQAADEQTDYMDSRSIEGVIARSGQYSTKLNLVASLHALRERWAYAGTEDDVFGPVYTYGTFTYPQLQAEYVDVDDRLLPRRGYAATAMLRGAVEGAGSDATFAQTRLTANWFKAVGVRSRFIVRGEYGHTYTDEVFNLPPTLRFYAGGDNSIRGYEYNEVGPSTVNAEGNRFYLGARNVVTASVEYEHYLANGWGYAAFVDSGDAFDDSPSWYTGVGVGLRWKSPVGPLRLDIARGLDDPNSAFTIGINIGSGL